MDWHIALIEPQAERIASEALRNRGYEVYYPAFPKQITHRGQTKRITMRPMFPGYMFANDAGGKGWGQLRPMAKAPGVPGVRASNPLLLINGRYAILSNAIIEEIMIVEQRLNHRILDDQKGTQFHVGQSVRIKDGPFAGFFAVIEALDDDQRIVLLMDLLRRESRVISSPSHLEPA
jgi:transcriptional antiterminator RfaH